LVKQLSENTAIVSSKELGTNCWLAGCFIEGDGRCCRVFLCNYPEKKTCQAVHAEITYLRNEQERLDTVKSNIGNRIVELSEML